MLAPYQVPLIFENSYVIEYTFLALLQLSQPGRDCDGQRCLEVVASTALAQRRLHFLV